MAKSIKKNIGRPLKLNPDVKKSLMGSIALGMSYVDSCAIAGIHYKTFLSWQNKGEEGKGKEYIDFIDEVKKAIATGKAQNVQAIKRDDSWQSKAWLLERQHPAEYGKKDKLEVKQRVTLRDIHDRKNKKNDKSD